jgi:8-oxo-dGTP pyrophosphatase MutT (NUDIX family)
VRANLAVPRKQAAKRTTGIQYAALPYRVSGETVEILLVTSRRTHRWILPKGWPIEGRRPPASAASEALEEAGVRGEIQKNAIGHYRYLKYHRNGTSEPCKVDIFALKVTHEENAWPEKDERKRRWYTVAEAAAAVDEPQLRLLILNFGAQMAAAGQH